MREGEMNCTGNFLKFSFSLAQSFIILCFKVFLNFKRITQFESIIESDPTFHSQHWHSSVFHICSCWTCWKRINNPLKLYSPSLKLIMSWTNTGKFLFTIQYSISGVFKYTVSWNLKTEDWIKKKKVSSWFTITNFIFFIKIALFLVSFQGVSPKFLHMSYNLLSKRNNTEYVDNELNL